MVSLNRHRVVFIIGGREFSGRRVDRSETALQHEACNRAVFSDEHFLRAPARVHPDVFFLSFLDFLRGGGHRVTGFETEHGNLRGTEPSGGSRAVDRDVSAADDDGFTGKLRDRAAERVFKEMHGDVGAFRGFIRDAGETAALAADRDIEGLIALLLQFVNRDIPADLHAAADLGAERADHVDFRGDDVLLQLVRRNTVLHHAARFLVLFKDRRLVAAGRKIVGAGKACGAGADDRDLLIPGAA